MKISAADTWFSKCIRERDGACVVCGKTEGLECSHIHGRRHRTIRWSMMNAVAKCHTCHRWWHENPTESAFWFREKYGQGHVDLLLEKKNERVKVPKLEEKEIAKFYREQYREAEGNPNHEWESWQ